MKFTASSREITCLFSIVIIKNLFKFSTNEHTPQNYNNKSFSCYYFKILLHISVFFRFKTWVYPGRLYLSFVCCLIWCFFSVGIWIDLVMLWRRCVLGWLSCMQISLLEEKSIFEERLIWGSSRSSLSIARRTIEDLMKTDVAKAVPVLK